jgi:hypothetical protein
VLDLVGAAVLAAIVVLHRARARGREAALP